MSDIKFEILYQAKTIFVILKIQEDTKNLFNKFIEQLKTSNITENYYWHIKYISLDK